MAPETLGKLCRIDARTGASALVAGVDIPDTDGVELAGRRLWAVQRFRKLVTHPLTLLDARVDTELDGCLVHGHRRRAVTGKLVQRPASNVPARLRDLILPAAPSGTSGHRIARLRAAGHHNNPPAPLTDERADISNLITPIMVVTNQQTDVPRVPRSRVAE